MNEAPVSNHTPAPHAAPALSLSDRVRSLRLPDRTTAARQIPWLPWILCGVFLLLAAVFALEAFAPIDDALLKKLAEERLGTVAAPGAVRATATAGSSAAATTQAGDIALEAKGYIVPVSTIQVSPIVGGRVMSLSFKEGDIVKKGTVLAQIETTEYQADYDRSLAQFRSAEAKMHELTKYRADEINQAKADLDDTKAQRDQLFLDFQRSGDLVRTKALSPKEFEQADYSYRAMDNRMKRLQFAYELIRKGPRDERIAAAQAEIGQYQADVTKNKWRLDNTKIIAPIDGIILTKKAEVSNYVNPSAFSNGLSASLCDMADLADMEVDLAIAERDLAKIRKGQLCEIRPEAFSDRTWSGEVSRIMPQADRAKGSVPVRVRIEIPRAESGQFLRPDMGAVVTFRAGKG